MAVDGCGQVCKFLLIIFNILFLLVGMAMFCAGVYLRVSAEEPLRTNHFIFVVTVLMAVGSLIVISAAVGDYGSCKENKSALGAYCSLMSFLLILTIIAGVLAFANDTGFSNHVGEFYATIYTQYMITQDWIRSIILKLFHNIFDCCGVGGAVQTILQRTETCPQKYNLLGISISTSTSCLTAILAGLKVSSVLGVFLGLAGVMLVVLGCSTVLYYSIKKSSLYTQPLNYY